MSGGAASKHKGSAFERTVCAKLSLWISKGQQDDLLWRSAMSGGRGTRRVDKHGAQKVSGDICSVGAGGHILTDWWHIEAKHVKNMNLTAFILKQTGFLATEWKRCERQAKSHDKLPMLIVRQNLMPDIVFVPTPTVRLGWVLLYSPKFMCAAYLLNDLVAMPYFIPRIPMAAPKVKRATLAPDR